jgi:hypothetical protein
MILTLIAGKLESRCLSTIVFDKEMDSFSGVTCYPGYAKVSIADLAVQVSTLNTGEILLIR